MSDGEKAMLTLQNGEVTDDFDRQFYREKVALRVRLLEEDEPIFGLVPDEVNELARLKQFLADGESA